MLKQTTLILFLFTSFNWVIDSHAKSLSPQSKTLANGARFEPSKCWFNLTSFPSGFKNLTWASGLKVRRIECGYFFTRKEQGKSYFRLPVVILRDSLWGNSKKPVLHIAGGPGSSSWLNQKDLSEFWLPYIDRADWQHDMVLYDARGTGLSKPALHCDHIFEDSVALFAKNFQPEEEAKAYYNLAEKCSKNLIKNQDQQSALQQLGTLKSADDLADLANLLNIESWHLYGTSYGTRLALEVARRHPDKVASLILDSVYPQEVDGEETLPALYLESLEGIMKACATDLKCSKNYPQLGKQLHDLLRRLHKKPITLMLDNKNTPVKLVLTPSRLFSILFDAGYGIDSVVVVPNAIHALHAGNTDPIRFLAQLSLELLRDKEFSTPVFMEVECNESEIKDQRVHIKNIVKKYKNYPILKRWQLAFFSEDICRSWGSKEINESFYKPVYSEKPALIFSGKFDSVTPPKWGKMLAKHLPNSEFHKFRSSGHGVLFDVDCAKKIVRRFLNPKLATKTNDIQGCKSKQVIWEEPDVK